MQRQWAYHYTVVFKTLKKVILNAEIHIKLFIIT